MEHSSENAMRYRLGLDVGTTSLGWAMLRLDKNDLPCAVIRTGVRIFSDGRVPKTGESLAVQRRLARQQRRTRDRYLKRRTRLINDLVELNFFPADAGSRRQLVKLDPYQLRAKGLDNELTLEEFGRAVFHLAQRRGFKSNRKTDAGESEASTMKTAISVTRAKLSKDSCRTIGEWLNLRHMKNEGTHCRLREEIHISENGKPQKNKLYDLYLDRTMVRDEFELLWTRQAQFKPNQYTQQAHDRLSSTIFFQRDLRPVKPGRCTLLPDEERAPLALPSQQRFRIYQEVNNLRKINTDLSYENLTLEERDRIASALDKKNELTFEQIKKLIHFDGDFNLEDDRRIKLNGNSTTAKLSKKALLGNQWLTLSTTMQDEIVLHLLNTQSEEELISWLQKTVGISKTLAEEVSNVKLSVGYGSLSKKALDRILPILTSQVITYDKAVHAAGFSHHSNLSHLAQTGEILQTLPYYGEYLQRHVGFGTGNIEDVPEKQFGKIANPTVHIGLNQVRKVVNALIAKYGRPTQTVIEVARELKLSRKRKIELLTVQRQNQKRRERIRREIAEAGHFSEEFVTNRDIEKWTLWEELNPSNTLERLCPYSGKQISAAMVLNGEVEIEHILPYARTLDDTMANKTVAIREANRIKGNRTPWEAHTDFEVRGWKSQDMLARADRMPRNKRFRFGEHGYEEWLKDNKDFVARALTDTQYFSCVAKEYLGLICPNTRCIPGQLTAMIRRRLGLNNILGDNGEKNRNDHRHHAVDACVIAFTDQSLLQRVATASAKTVERGAGRVIDTMPAPWPTYFESVRRSIEAIKVSHRPDHSYQGGMHDQTAFGLLENGEVITHKIDANGKRVSDKSKLLVIPFACEKANWRHGTNPDGTPKFYKGYKGNSNYCMEIFLNEKGKWQGIVISTYQAYQIVREKGEAALRTSTCQNGKPLVMRLMINDTVRMTINGETKLYLIYGVRSDQIIYFCPINEANVSNRTRDKTKSLAFTFKTPGSLQKTKAKFVTISPIGIVKVH